MSIVVGSVVVVSVDGFVEDVDLLEVEGMVVVPYWFSISEMT